MTLRTRLLIGMAVIAIALFADVLYNAHVTRRELIGQVDERLIVLVQAGTQRESDYSDYDADATRDPESFERISDLYEGYLDVDGELHTVFTPNSPGEEPAGAPEVDVGDVPDTGNSLMTARSTDGGTQYRVLVRAADSDVALAWVIAIPIDDLESTIDRLALERAGAAVAVLGALGLVSWWVVHLGIRPMRRMTDVAAQIGDGDLSVRVPETRPTTESGVLATALNRMLGRLQVAIDDKSRSEERLRQFVADASHELRTPVTTIRGYAELYRIGGLSDPDALDDAMRRTEQQATRMSRLVDELLTLAELDRERELEQLPVDMVEVARDAVADGRVRAPEREFTARADADRAVVIGDPDRLRQAVDNLIGNAVVHANSHVEVTVGVVDGEVLVAVSDSGGGMPPDVAARATERFYRADSSRVRTTGGNGLGLSIVEAIAAAHGGSVVIESVEGDGTTVRIILPQAPSATL